MMLYGRSCIGNGYDAVGINAQWSVVNGVTLVLVVVAAMATCHLSAFNAVTTVLFEATVTDGSFLHRLDCLLQLCSLAMAIRWAGTNFA
jgi:hypothetical protein